MKNLTIAQLNKKVELQANDIKTLNEQRDVLLYFFKSFKQNYEAGLFKFNTNDTVQYILPINY